MSNWNKALTKITNLYDKRIKPLKNLSKTSPKMFEIANFAIFG